MSTYFIPALFCGFSICSGVGFNVERTGFGILELKGRTNASFGWGKTKPKIRMVTVEIVFMC